MNNQSMHRPTQTGFTFIELMVAIAIVAILITAAVPSLQQIIRDSRVSSQANEIVALINLTRNQAIREGIDANDAEEALVRLNSTTGGWEADVLVSGAPSDDRCTGDGIIRCAKNANVLLTTGSDTLSFESRGFLAPFAEKVMCLKHTGDDSCAGTRQHVEIRVLGTGQVRTRNLACTDACPAG